MDEENIDEFNFQPDETEKMVTDIIDGQLAGQQYNEDMVAHWINVIQEKILENLINQCKPYKYMVNCMIMQRNGMPVFNTCSCYWDSVPDNCAIVKWPKDKESKGEQAKNQLNCIVTVFASCLNPNH